MKQPRSKTEMLNFSFLLVNSPARSFPAHAPLTCLLSKAGATQEVRQTLLCLQSAWSDGRAVGRVRSCCAHRSWGRPCSFLPLVEGNTLTKLLFVLPYIFSGNKSPTHARIRENTFSPFCFVSVQYSAFPTCI